MKKLHLDWETYCDLDIRKVGAYKYAQHPSCCIILGGYEFGNSKKTWIWDGTESSEVPTRLWNAINDPDTLIYAFNANFERLIIKYVMGLDLPIERFRCTMVQAYGLCFAGSLADVGEQLGISKAKLTEGKELIKLFCTPRKPTKKKPWTRTLPEHEPEKWEAFKSYCIRDVDAEHEVLQKIDD